MSDPVPEPALSPSQAAELFALSATDQPELAITEPQTAPACPKGQEMLRVLLDSVQAGIVACNAEGILTLFNRTARQFHGLPEQPLPPDQWAEYYDLYRPDGKTRMPKTEIPLFRALQGEIVDQVEMVIAPKTGMRRTLLASGQAIVNAQGEKQGAVVVMHDITERKLIENALRKSEAQLSSIFQTIPNGIVILDQKGRLITANSAAEQILRLTRSDLTERLYNDPSWSITTVDGQPFPDQELPFVQVMQTGKPVYAVEHAITHSDGTRIILSINASPLFDTDENITHVITAISDITERKQAEASLRESEERYRSVIEAAAEGIVLQHSDGTIFTCNASAERILGLTAAQMMGRTSLDPRWAAIYEDGSPFPGELHPAMVTLRTGAPQSNVVMGICKPDGSLTWISINTRPLFQPGHSMPFAVVASFFDITERKQAEAVRLRLAEEQAQLMREQAARLEAEAEQRRASFLAEVSTVLASSLDYEQTLQSVAQLAVPYFADWCSVDLLNDDGTISRVAVAHSDPEKVQLGWELAQRFPRHLDDGYGISQVMKTGQSEIAIEITDEQLAASVPNPDYLEILRGVGLKSCIISPLPARERVLGSITFVFTESNRHYNLDDLRLAEDLARRAAIAIDNAHLYHMAQQAKQAAEKAAERTARLQTVTAALSESLTPEQVAEVIVEQSMAALAADAALVALLNPEGTALEIVRAVGYAASPEEIQQPFPIQSALPLAEAVRTGQPVWAEPLSERLARYPHLAETYQRFPFQTWVSLPLIVEGKAVGGLSLSFLPFKQLSQDEREFILALSRQCAQAISRAQLYEAERQARAEAEQANRVKDEFLAILSHELRTPLNPILGWSKLLQIQPLDEQKTRQALATIERNAKLQAELIEDLLDVSRILRGKLSLDVAPVDLKSTIAAAMDTVRLAADAKRIELHFTISTGVDATPSPPRLLQVMGDAGRLQQVVWNLLSNAVKFTPEGGRVEVRLERSDSQAQITVTDTGKGIAPEFLPYVFDYFRQEDGTTTRRFGGLGLGLAIVRHITELHGGTVWAESLGEGLGATFTVQLPLMTSAGSVDQQEESPMMANLTGLKVLAVDDDDDIRELIEFILQQAGAEVRVVASAVEVLQQLDLFAPDLLICDIGMPEMDGYMLMRQIRDRQIRQATGQFSQTLPKAIALTAYAGELDQQQALTAGFQLHLAKPVEPEQLIRAIVTLLHQHPASAD
ncbi:PAS domain S-box protein [Leptolyngbya sp. NK1-12]|uniref:Circadian input-output histidine kinase CikA n=1 Tax=Leptolyngbya sp. NK1-12 TaxID=2547451 RepID=A0AA96WKU2_9CYAN|nr:PAS domain S-box protein [Leptolyngbya sp. NK1-12]WNZ27727.1 PAS domain S-box protein [Leptolyngbya sp. NK1-12]